MDIGEHQWMIDVKLLKPMLTAKNQEKFISPKFKMSHLTWQIEAYPNGNTSTCPGSFNVYLRLVTMPIAWQNITIRRTFTCNETKSGYVAVSRFEKNTSLGWPDYTLALKDVKNRYHWLKQLTFTINIKILQIRLRRNDGEIFYENRLDPYRSLKKQTVAWKLDDDTIHEMKQAYFKKGFVSPIYSNMWCLRVYPNGKNKKGDFLVQLQLVGLPQQTNKINVNWKIHCHAVSLTAGWTTEFDFSQSCWGWGHSQLSFEQFKKCNKFTISVDIIVDDKINVIAMAEWQKFVNKKKRPKITAVELKEIQKAQDDDKTEEEDDEEDDGQLIGVTQNSLRDLTLLAKTSRNLAASVQPKMGQLNEEDNGEINERLKSQDDILEELSKEIGELRNEVDRLIEADAKQTQYNDMNNASNSNFKKQINQIKKQIEKLSQMKGGDVMQNDEEELSDEEKVKQWLTAMNLPKYFDTFMQEGFDDLDGISNITMEDLVQMGVEKKGHRRKILTNAKKLSTMD